MLRCRFLCLFLSLQVVLACTTPSSLEESSPELQKLTLSDLSLEPLPPAVVLTQDYFRKSYPHLSADAFQQKWVKAQTSGLMFIRSFVNTWYDELAKVSKLGPIGPCFGDPHPENFGFLDFGGKLEFFYNDLDDSGACPVAFDALRYFTTLKLYLKDPQLEADLRRYYVRFLNGEKLVDRASLTLNPGLAAAYEKTLKKAVKKGKIERDPTTLSLDAAEAQALFENAQSALVGQTTAKFLDATRVVVSSGGSAGLQRYWLLIQAADQSTQLLEYKELVEPASQRGSWASTQKVARTEIIKFIWQKQRPTFFALTEFRSKSFLVRSRTKADIELDDLKVDQKRAVLTEQVWLLAQLHRQTLTGSGLLEEWLGRQSEFEAKRYSEALLAARGS